MRKQNSGQATIIILTMMVAAVGIGLFLTRGVQTDLQMTKVQEESARAFSAAEAGIDSALYSWTPGEQSLSLETGDVSVLSSNLGEGEARFNFPGTVAQGDFGTIWLAVHSEDGEIDEGNYYQSSNNRVWVCWENSAALELILFYKSGDYKTERWAFDPDSDRRDENSFAAPDAGGCAGLNLKAVLNLPDGTPLFIIAKSYYGETALGAQATAGAVFPSQGKLVVSTGEVDTLGDKVVSRRLQVLQTWDIPPLIFFEPVFSGSSIQAP